MENVTSLSLYFCCEQIGFPINSRLVRWYHWDTACIRSMVSLRQLCRAVSDFSSCRHCKSATDVRPLLVTSKTCRDIWNGEVKCSLHCVMYSGFLFSRFVKIIAVSEIIRFFLIFGMKLSNYNLFSPKHSYHYQNCLHNLMICFFASKLTASPFIVLGSNCRVSPCGSCWFCMCNSFKLQSLSNPSITVMQLYPKYLQTQCTSEFGIVCFMNCKLHG